ncbi:FHA domain-containing protein [Prosthecobacter sp.]
MHLKWSGGRLPLGRSCVIGRRSDNDLPLNDAQVSRRHALLMRFGEEWWLNDLDSRNGVSVNGLKIKSARRLRDGDQIRIASHTIVFHNGTQERARSSIVGRTTQVTLADADGKAPRHDLIIASSKGEIIEGDKAAHRFFGTLTRPHGGDYYLLPMLIRQWIERMSRPEATSTPLEMHDGDRRIIVSLSSCKEGRFFIALREDSVKSSLERLVSLGLTEREAEVMHWVSEGRSNPDIAKILKITIHTVNRHLEHIFCKLVVDNRQQAITAVRDRLGM